MKKTNDERSVGCVDTQADNEEWRPIPGYEGLYEVSNLGRVKSLGRYVRHPKGGMRLLRERILKQGIAGRGYHQVALCRNGRSSIKLVGRLVAESFLTDYSEELEVDHRYGDTLNDAAWNLRMVTHIQNLRAHHRPRKGCSSRFRGVSWHKSVGKWQAAIRFDHKKTHLGLFIDETDAARAYNAKATELGFFPEALNQI